MLIKAKDRHRSKLASGFTLIELLVTVAIIGILAAIAIPNFSEYRKRAYDVAAQSDLRNLVTAVTAVIFDGSINPAILGDLMTNNAVADFSGFRSSKNIEMALLVDLSDSGEYFVGGAYHPLGTKVFCYNSLNNVLFESVPIGSGPCAIGGGGGAGGGDSGGGGGDSGGDDRGVGGGGECPPGMVFDGLGCVLMEGGGGMGLP